MSNKGLQGVYNDFTRALEELYKESTKTLQRLDKQLSKRTGEHLENITASRYGDKSPRFSGHRARIHLYNLTNPPQM